jgi:protein TonB
MGREIQNIPDFDDLLFETRNKEYGAYQLRKRYNRVLLAGILVSISIGCAAVLLPFLIKLPEDKVLRAGSRYVQVNMEALEPPVDLVVPPSPPPPESKAIQDIVKYIPPEVVDTIFPLSQTPATTDEILAQSGDNTELEYVGNGMGEDLLSGEGGTELEDPFFLVEVMPSFRGGDLNKFREWVQKRTNYPQEALDRKIQGRIFLTFIVETDGAVSNVTVVKGVDPMIDSEAIRAIQGSPKWTPGLQRGQPVRVRYSMWLAFII